MDKLVAYYKKSSEQELRDEMFELNKNGQMATMMQQSVIKDLEVTPEEVRQFFNKIDPSERPMFGTELRIAQIVVIPETRMWSNHRHIHSCCCGGCSSRRHKRERRCWDRHG